MSPRRKRNLIDAVISRSTGQLCVLDEERKIRFFSPGMEQLTGWKAEDIEGLICNSSVTPAVSPIELLTSALYPSTEVMEGASQTVSTVLPRSRSAGLSVVMTFLPIADEDAAITRIIILVESEKAKPSPAASLTQRLHAELTSLRVEFRRRFSESSFLGNCAEIRTALAQAELLKNSECGYSIVGPEGSGRRHLAKMIHVSGRQHEHSLVPLECRLLTAEQVLDALRQLRRQHQESTGASNLQTGTLLLQDAQDCPREVQQWLCEDMQTEREGIRIVAIANRSLNDAELDDWMRPDFRNLFRTLQIKLPPLHRRGQDISILSQHFIEEARRTLETSASGMSEELEREIRFYRWPGNVRELKQVIFDACQNSFSELLQTEDLPFSFRAGLNAQELPVAPQGETCSLEQLMTQFETDVIVRTLEACGDNKAEAARRLGMTRPRFYRRMKSLGLEDTES